jgi:hypothetical protein
MSTKKENYDIAKETAKTKTELANELGVPIPRDGYWGNMTAKTCGTVGGAIRDQKVKTAIESFERSLLGEPKE